MSTRSDELFAPLKVTQINGTTCFAYAMIGKLKEVTVFRAPLDLYHFDDYHDILAKVQKEYPVTEAELREMETDSPDDE